SSISHLVRIDIRVILVISLQFFDQGVERLRIIFRNIKLNAGGIKGQDVSKRGVNQAADRLREIDHLMEHLLDVRFKGSLEARKKRSVRDFGKATEIP